MKKHELTLKTTVILSIASGLLFGLMLFIFTNNLLPRDNKILYVTTAIICFVLLFDGFIGFIVFSEGLVFTIVLNKKAKKYHKRMLIKIHECLSTKDFSEITLKMHDDSIIPLEKFICKAKLDEDGNIIYNISLNFESETDDYENFLKHFSIENTDKFSN